MGFLVQCALCQDIFTRHDFPLHICEEQETVSRPCKEEPPAQQHPCMAQLEDNWSRIRKFIKEELKMQIDLSTAVDSKLECHICFKRLSSKPSLVKHLAKHDADPKETSIPTKGNAVVRLGPVLEYDVCFVCLLCGRAFANVEQCEDHLWNSASHQDDVKQQHGIILPSATGPSEETCLSVDSMKMDAVVVKLVFQCEFCDYLFARKEDLLKHEATHDPKLGYICTRCEINTPAARDMQHHWQMQCPFIPGRTAEKQSSPKTIEWPAELARISVATDFVCNVCFETFPSLDILYDHRYLFILGVGIYIINLPLLITTLILFA